MAGIYIHIPFCKSKCFYCDFYSIKDTNKSIFLKVLKKEIVQQKVFIQNEKIKTIYFGGGTPSVLSVDELTGILETIFKYYSVSKDAEITFEANPDDLNINYLTDLHKSEINRLSIGVQSFSDVDLLLMNRRHNSETAIEAIKNAQNIGFDNISIDLIYGLPKMQVKQFSENLDIAMGLGVQHIAAYHLSIEKGTEFHNLYEKGKIDIINEDESFKQYKLLLERTKQNNFIQYEISNFGLRNHFSKHNTSYWNQEKYYGFGPSAHSFNGDIRRWNVSDVNSYIKNVLDENVFFEQEKLTISDKYNDYIITSIRTMWGVNLDFINTKFGIKYSEFFLKKIHSYINSKHFFQKENSFILTDKGVFISNKIMEDFIML